MKNKVILENCRKNNQIWTNYDRHIHVTKFDCGLKREMSLATRDRLTVLHSPIEQRRKQRAPPPTAAPTVPTSAVLTPRGHPRPRRRQMRPPQLLI
jgi:hypothetical protein